MISRCRACGARVSTGVSPSRTRPSRGRKSIQDLQNTLVTASGRPIQEILSNFAVVKRQQTAEVINHYNVQPTYDIYANVQDRDLGSVSRDISRILKDVGQRFPHGTAVEVRGQVESMNASFLGLGAGLIFSILFVYLLLVVNFSR